MLVDEGLELRTDEDARALLASGAGAEQPSAWPR